ncbi:MAG: MMPL family transporter [Desulfobulbus sp.]|nr:MMPL family transporter [Desulfobulbus sp.]
MKPGIRHLPVALWLAAMLACVLVIANTRFVSDLSAFMPRSPSERQQLLIDQLRDGALARLIMIGIEGGDAGERARLSRELGVKLRASGLFVGIQNGDAAMEQRDRLYFFDNRYLLAPDLAAADFTVDGLHAAISDSITALAGDAGLFLKKIFPRDPTGQTLQLLEQFVGKSMPHSEHGAWASVDGQRAVLLAYTRAPGTDTRAQAEAIDAIRQTFAQLPERQADTRILLSGTSVFSVQSRNTIEGEVSKLASASLLLVASLLLLVYRSPRLLALGLLPVLTGALTGIAAVSLSFGQVHGLTLGFGTTLIGEAVDYSIYFYLQRAGQLNQKHFWRTVWLGVSTSIAGFSVLLFSGFPGLAQLGVYSVCGLIAAVLATRYLLPTLLPQQLDLRDLHRFGLAFDGLLNRTARLRWLPLLFAVIAAAVIVQHRGQIWNRNLATLSPISKADQQLDLKLRNDLGAPDLRFMLAFAAPSEELALQGAEKAGAVLRELTQQKLIAGFDSPAFALPSQAAQRARQHSIPDADEMRRRLPQALAGLPVGSDKLQAFLADLQAARDRAPLLRADLDGTSAALLVDSLLFKRSNDTLVLILLRTQDSSADRPLDIDRVQAALEKTGLPHLVVIDLLEESTNLFDDYRHEIFVLAALGCLVICVLLLFALRSAARMLRVTVPLFCAIACVTAVLLASGAQLTILHLVSLLLVVAIGSNYALFFESGGGSDTPEERRRMQVSLVVATTCIIGSFGILALSNIPVLSSIGSTVGLGALFAFVFSMFLSRRVAA